MVVCDLCFHTAVAAVLRTVSLILVLDKINGTNQTKAESSRKELCLHQRSVDHPSPSQRLRLPGHVLHSLQLPHHVNIDATSHATWGSPLLFFPSSGSKSTTTATTSALFPTFPLTPHQWREKINSPQTHQNKRNDLVLKTRVVDRGRCFYLRFCCECVSRVL